MKYFHFIFSNKVLKNVPDWNISVPDWNINVPIRTLTFQFKSAILHIVSQEVPRPVNKLGSNVRIGASE